MGSTALGNVTVNGTSVVTDKTGNAPNASVQVWCTNKAFFAAGGGGVGGGGAATAAASGGAITVAIANAASVAQKFTVPSIASLTPRIEYVLTASEAMYRGGVPTATAAGVAQLPDALWNDEIYLNGDHMSVSGKGELPEFPIPGKTRSAQKEGTSFLFPAFSYGFVVFPNADVTACNG
jgi:hypothetical protein